MSGLNKLLAIAPGVTAIIGGGGKTSHLADVLTTGKADAALIASMVHSGDYTIGSIKSELNAGGIPVRLS